MGSTSFSVNTAGQVVAPCGCAWEVALPAKSLSVIAFHLRRPARRANRNTKAATTTTITRANRTVFIVLLLSGDIIVRILHHCELLSATPWLASGYRTFAVPGQVLVGSRHEHTQRIMLIVLRTFLHSSSGTLARIFLMADSSILDGNRLPHRGQFCGSSTPARVDLRGGPPERLELVCGCSSSGRWMNSYDIAGLILPCFVTKVSATRSTPGKPWFTRAFTRPSVGNRL